MEGPDFELLYWALITIGVVLGLFIAGLVVALVVVL